MGRIITNKQIKRMARMLLSEIKKFPTYGVTEDLPTFSERKRRLVGGSSARPGPYSYSKTPQWREVAFEMSEASNTIEGVVMAATQTGKTENMLNHELYCVEYGIGPICYVSSDEGLALKHSETRFKPMLKAAGMLKDITAPVQSKANKSTGDKVNLKFFKGTFIQFIGARSESKASSTPIRILHIDEIDKFPLQLTGGGNPVVKLVRRTDSYDTLKKVFYVSTPKRKATSQIEPLFKQGDMRYYHVECPSCGKLHRLEWKYISWDKDDKGFVLLEYDENDVLTNNPVYHICPHCDYRMKDYEKRQAMKEEGYGGKAKWIPSKRPDKPGLKSWHCSGLYGFRNWLDIALEFQEAKDDPILLEDFICDTLAETWEETIEKPDEHYLMARAESDWNRGFIPEDVKLLSLGCDVQGDRIEACIMGWGTNMEAWAIDYYVFTGEPNDPNDDCWNRLEDVIKKEWKSVKEEKTYKIQIALVDAPFQNDSVMAFCERFPYNGNWQGVFPCYGRRNISKVVKDHVSSIQTPELLIDDQILKKQIYSCLKRKVPLGGHKYPRGFIHFPSEYPEDYYKQLTAEEVIPIVDSKGREDYEINNPKQRRNEVLDTMKMCRAGIYYMYNNYFYLYNKSLKQSQKKEVDPDWRVFWGLF